MATKDAYEDDDKIPFGKYKGTALCEVPASYLHYLWTKRPIWDTKLQKYIENSLDALKQEYPDGIWS